LKTDKTLEKLARDEVVLGPFIMLPSPGAVELAALAGFDFCIFDMEHSSIGFETAENMARAADAAGITPVIRVPDRSQTNILRALEAGAVIVDVPLVGTAAQVRDIVYAAKYHPAGGRGFNLGSRGNRYGTIASKLGVEALADANRRTKIMIQIETVEGVENVEEICSVEGLDGVFVGVADLSQSMGIPLQFGDALMANVEKVLRTVSAAGKIAGAFAVSTAAAKQLVAWGARFISPGTDIGAMLGSFRKVVADFSEAVTQ